MNDNDKQIAREAAKKLLAWADGATLEWASGGVDIPHPQFIALHVLAGNTVRIRPPAAPPEPKPSQEFLAKNCIEIVSGPMSWQQARANPAYHSLQAVCLHTDGRGGTGEWICTGVHVGLCGNAGPSKLTYLVRPVAQTAPPSLPPKPSQAVLEACKRLGAEAWKLAKFEHGDDILTPGSVSEDGVSVYDAYASSLHVWTADHKQCCGTNTLYWHVRPVAQTAPPSLPCPPRPTDDQVSAARLNGKRVRLTGQCEEPNGRPWFSILDCALMSPSCSPVDDDACGARRWIAEVIEDEPRPWELDPKHANKVVVRKDGKGWGVISGQRDGVFFIPGHGCASRYELLRDWTWNGQPCGDVS